MALTGLERQLVESVQRALVEAHAAQVTTLPEHHLYDFPVRVSDRRLIRAIRRLSRRGPSEEVAAARDWRLRRRRGVNAGGGMGVLVPDDEPRR